MESIDLELRCPVDQPVLSMLRSFVTTVAAQAGFEDEEIDQIEMAVDEGCANVVRHAYRDLGFSTDGLHESVPMRGDGCQVPELLLKVRITDDVVRFRIIDTGTGRPANAKRCDSIQEFVDRGGNGGLGSLIMENFMDEVLYELSDGGQGTTLTLIKYRSVSAPRR